MAWGGPCGTKNWQNSNREREIDLSFWPLIKWPNPGLQSGSPEFNWQPLPERWTCAICNLLPPAKRNGRTCGMLPRKQKPCVQVCLRASCQQSFLALLVAGFVWTWPISELKWKAFKACVLFIWIWHDIKQAQRARMQQSV